MKKLLTVLAMIFAITAGSFTTASATDFLIGAKGGYFVWDPYLKRSGSSMFDSMENGNGQLYGPVFSLLFTSDLSLSVSGLFGQQSANWIETDFSQGTSSSLKTASYSMDITRVDIDTALSYRLTENFKLIAGYKYQLFDMTIENVSFNRNTSTGVTTGGYEKNEIKMPFHGPALGLGFSAPVGEKFFFAGNLSALYMWGKFDFNSTEYYYNTSDGNKHFSTGAGEGMNNVTMRTRGINCEPTVGASIGEGLPIVTLGIRFQWSQTKFINMPTEAGINDKWNNDYQYGLFVSVVQPI
jgi:hypothetical protein